MFEYQLFNRYVRVVAGTVDIGQLDATFTVEKNLSKEPNKCELQIYNLNPTKRKILATQKNLPVQIKAGYLGRRDQALPTDDFLIFNGDITQIFSSKQGPDWITTLRTADGIEAKKLSRIQKSYKKNQLFKNIAQDLITAYRVNGKKALLKIAQGNFAGALNTVLNSYTVSGSVNKELDKLLDQFGLSGSVQDGELVILGPNETLGTEAIVLGSDTGLIGSPEIDNNGFLRCRSLLRPEFKPGYQISVDGSAIKGFFRIERVTYTGSTFGQEWYCDIEGRPIG